MTPQQCRLARDLLGWSARDLAAAAAVPVEIVDRFEAEALEGWAGLELDMRATLEAHGARFIGADRVECVATSPQPRSGGAPAPSVERGDDDSLRMLPVFRRAAV